MKHSPGIGATKELSLRVSVATLARVIFEHPQNGDLILALERRATLYEAGTERVVEVKSQPFGGAIRIHDIDLLQNIIGDFNFDSTESFLEKDFRLFIQPSAWEAVRGFCLEQFHTGDGSVLESDPRRELVEEFVDALGISLKPDQYTYEPVGAVIENEPSPTDNVHAKGYPTVRIYRIFEARILSPALAHAILANSESYSDPKLRELASENSRNGGPGRANAVLTLPLSRISIAYLSIIPEARNAPISFENHRLDETVTAVLENMLVPKYRRV
ncbi:MAG TPA: hypothetical protein VMN99_07320 [Anaerolineales bacterium]|nr:hypothetical protein [Anaerolineales bacterium]